MAHTVHEVRVALKRLRAVLKLVRRATDQNATTHGLSKSILGQARECAGLLAPVRDFDVLRKMGTPFHHVLSKGPRFSLKERRHILTKIERESSLWSEDVEFICHEITNGGVTLAELKRGLRKNIKRAKKKYLAARLDSKADNLHEWRKATKDLHFQFEALGFKKYGVLSSQKLKQLGVDLGDARDYFRFQPLITSKTDAAFRVGQSLFS